MINPSRSQQHTIDRRAKLLAEKIRHFIEVRVEAYAPVGENTPGQTQLANKDALAWWRAHRFDDLGKQVIARMTPTEIMAIDVWLGANPDPAVTNARPEL